MTLTCFSRLPTIIDTLENQVTDVTRELATLPVPPQKNYLIIVDRIITVFSEDVVQHLSGIPGKNVFQMELRELGNRLNTTLKVFRPNIVMLATLEEEQEEMANVTTPHKNREATGDMSGFGDQVLSNSRKRRGSPGLAGNNTTPKKKG